MDLFAKDETFKEYQDFQKARNEFRETNIEMTDTIKIKSKSLSENTTTGSCSLPYV